MFEISEISTDETLGGRGRKALEISPDVVTLYTTLKGKGMTYGQSATIPVADTTEYTAVVQRGMLNRDLRKLVKADNETEGATVSWVVSVGPLVGTKDKNGNVRKGIVKVRLYSRTLTATDSE